MTVACSANLTSRGLHTLGDIGTYTGVELAPLQDLLGSRMHRLKWSNHDSQFYDH